LRTSLRATHSSPCVVSIAGIFRVTRGKKTLATRWDARYGLDSMLLLG
jgi:hypothetical protein